MLDQYLRAVSAPGTSRSSKSFPSALSPSSQELEDLESLEYSTSLDRTLFSSHSVLLEVFDILINPSLHTCIRIAYCMLLCLRIIVYVCVQVPWFSRRWRHASCIEWFVLPRLFQKFGLERLEKRLVYHVLTRGKTVTQKTVTSIYLRSSFLGCLNYW